MSHYFTNDKPLKENEKDINFYFNGKKFIFTTNSGMFSPDAVDEGTIILLSNINEISGDVLDLGCAYGVIGIVLSQSFAQVKSLTMSDVNDFALEYAKKNLEKNNVTAKLVNSNSYENIVGKFDNVILNPPIHAGKAKIYQMYEETQEHLNDEGKLYLVIRQKHGAPSSIRKLKELFKSVDTIYKKSGIFVVSCTK